MEFRNFKMRMQENFKEMVKDVTTLFEVELDKDVLWSKYLDSFPLGKNDIFRKRREHDCSACRSFIRNMGNVVKIKDGVVTTIWGFDAGDAAYQPSIDAMDAYVKSLVVSDIFVNTLKFIGTDKNFEIIEEKSHEWQHLCLSIPDTFVTNLGGKTIDSIKGDKREDKGVFKRALEELTEDSVLTVLELIAQNSLYKGEEWNGVLKQFLTHKKEFAKAANKDNYAWENSVKVGKSLARIRNTSVGTLLINLSEGMELDLAVRKYEQVVAPENYKRPKAIFTKKMLEDAEKTIVELGYASSLGRRHATLNDITINNILFANRDSASKMSGGILADLKKDIAVSPKQFSKVEEITIVDFVKDVLPTAKEIEVYLENKHSKNLVTLIAPEDKDSKTMFKWDNNFSWAYTGNITDSSMKENVKKAGGKVDGDLRFSIQWNDITRDTCDLDAHCIEYHMDERLGEMRENYEINFRNRNTFSPNRGKLDVDIISPVSGKASVENITYASRKDMKDGNYSFYVNYFSGRTTSGFRAEIEFDGTVYAFDVRDNMPGKIHIATVTLKDGVFTIVEKVKSTTSSKELWKLNTNQFIPASVVMYSPNYWNEQDGIGNKHYFFMLKGCVNTEEGLSGFYNEFLKEELGVHKRVFEALSSKMRVKESPDQLSGLGFSSTQRNEVVVKVKGNVERILRVKF